VRGENPAVDVWLHAFSFAHRTAELARQVEGWGFDGMLVADSQNLNADVWIELALAAATTERLHLGLGRGDSAVTQIGRRPVATSELERELVVIQGLLSGQEVELADGARSRIGWIAESERPKVPVAVASPLRSCPSSAALSAARERAPDVDRGEHVAPARTPERRVAGAAELLVVRGLVGEVIRDLAKALGATFAHVLLIG
jgi:hypothetical protein